MNLLHNFRITLAASILAVATFATAGDANATSANTDATDIWWNPQKSGMGFQLINTGTFIFATGFVYGANNQPTWFYANLNNTSANPITYSGNLGVATGPFYGGAFNPNSVIRRVAGTMTFVLTSVTTGQISYVVDGVSGNEPVERQPLTLDDYSGNYLAVVTQTNVNCLRPELNGTLTDIVSMFITQNEQGASLIATASDGGRCTYTGTYSQLGRMGQIQGTYDCDSGSSGSANLFEMNIVPYMFTARLQAHSNNFGCDVRGEISGLIPR